MSDTHETQYIKRGRGRPKKVAADETSGEAVSHKKVGLPMLLEPNEHDIRDELGFLDSYNYSRYNE
jgi:hypothetical protein